MADRGREARARKLVHRWLVHILSRRCAQVFMLTDADNSGTLDATELKVLLEAGRVGLSALATEQSEDEETSHKWLTPEILAQMDVHKNGHVLMPPLHPSTSPFPSQLCASLLPSLPVAFALLFRIRPSSSSFRRAPHLRLSVLPPPRPHPSLPPGVRLSIPLSTLPSLPPSPILPPPYLPISTLRSPHLPSVLGAAGD